MSKNIQQSKVIDKEQLKEKAGTILQHISGYISTRVMEIGKEMNIFEELANYPSGITAEDLAENLEYDPEYLQVWLNSAYSFDLIELENQTYTLSDYVEPLLLDREFSSYIGAFPILFNKKQIFDNFKENLVSGNRVWWNDLPEDWIKQVAKTTYPMYNRMLDQGFNNIAGLKEKLTSGVKFLEMASGAGTGLSQIVDCFPKNQYVGLDGDQYSINVAKEKMADLGFDENVTFIHSSFEDMDIENEFDVIFINASMHECRDINKVTANVYQALTEGGIFVISDLPAPASETEYRKLPSQLMLGIDFFESQIDDLLLPTQFYLDLLHEHEFENVDSLELSPTHSVIFGYKN